MRSIAAIEVEDADTRRRLSKRLGRLGLPGDLAAAAALLTEPGRQNNRALTFPDPREHPCGLPCLTRERVLVPLVEPNIVRWLRLIAEPDLPTGRTDEAGIVTVRWRATEDREKATAAAFDAYLRVHAGLRDIADFPIGLDSWHQPLALVPVRHSFADGSPTVASWMAADGTARVFGARIALAGLFGRFLTPTVDPWTDPATVWPNDAVTVRKVIAAARRWASTTGTTPGTDFSLSSPFAEDWADLLLPAANLREQVTMWSTGTTPPTATARTTSRPPGSPGPPSPPGSRGGAGGAGSEAREPSWTRFRGRGQERPPMNRWR